MKARSECVAPRTFGFAGGVVEIMRMFHAASPASHTPALSPTRGSGVGAVADTIGSAGLGSVDGGGPYAGAVGPRPPRPAGAAASVAGAPAEAAAAAAPVEAGVAGAAGAGAAAVVAG